jgi:hypothetical protein
MAMAPRSSLVRAFSWGGALALCLAGASGCGGGAVGNADTGNQFIAYSADFDGYQSWQSLSFDSPTASGATHIAGPRTVYINHAPQPGATTFPLGTIIVKVTADGQTFARVKRGGGFNAAYGVPDWEWFELYPNTTSIHWRGYGPPKGEAYGGDANAGCNMCHKLAAATDYVLSPGLAAMLAVDGGTPSIDGAVMPDGETGSDSGVDAGVNADSDAGVDAGMETDSNDASPE